MVRVCRLAVGLVAVVLLAPACTMNDTETPPLAGPSELALSLTLYANPDVIAQDGASQSQVIIQARDQSGQPIKNLPLRLDASVNMAGVAAGRLSAQTVVTDSDGRASVSYTAPPALPGNVDQGVIVTILATPIGTNYGNAVPRGVDIRLVPSATGGVGPNGSFTFAPFNPVPNGTVAFNASGSQSDVPITGFAWNFGDGSLGTGMTPQHVFRAAGTFTVTLIVTDANGRTSNPFSLIVVVGTSQAPTADFVFSPTDPVAGTVVYFNAAVSKAGPGRTLVDYSWNLGVPGPVQKGITVTKQYTTVGTYIVTLTVTDDVGSTSTTSKTVTIR